MRVGIIADIHEPFSHCLYRQFCVDLFKRWRVDQVVLVGDVVDHHAISRWTHDPDGLSAGNEYLAAAGAVSRWRKSFPVALVCIGNHDHRAHKLAHENGLPARYLRSYRELWSTPSWSWDFEHQIDGVLYLHGTGSSGKDSAVNLAIQRRKSVVMGHTHTYAGVKFHANTDNIIFGMNVGCGIDIKAYSFAYGRDWPVRPVLAAGIVIDGQSAYVERMPCGPKEKYHRSRAGKSGRKNHRASRV